jgi:hypothetical protein
LPYDDQYKAKPLWGAIAQALENARRPDLTTKGQAH